ncbi:MAG: DUF4159 domain-containing protein [Flavobacteriales bacterium]|nr:DUF4159 domain-containing protein [Flavobacteriales bacterium]
MSYRTAHIILIAFSLFCGTLVKGQDASSYQIALLKYNGGGDWYANPTALPNLVKFCNKNLGTSISTDIETVDAGDPAIFNYPFVHMTGHGNVVFSAEDVQNLRNYMLGGGFLHIDDNYGMDKFVRSEIKKIFPNNELVELPYTHEIFHQTYNFPKGLPKIHKHDDKRAQAFGILHEGRLVCLYTYETDLGDGWEDEEVHGDTPEQRALALKMGANIIQYAFTAFH